VTGSGRAGQIVDVDAGLVERLSKALVHENEYGRLRTFLRRRVVSERVQERTSAVGAAGLPSVSSPRNRDERRSAMATTGFPRYPAIPVATNKVQLVCAGEARTVLEDDGVTERRSPEGVRLWKVPCMLGSSGQLRRSEIVQVTIASEEAPAVEFGERLEADRLVVFFWGMERNGELIAGLSFRADNLRTPTARKAA
jgi:hypothetical protein